MASPATLGAYFVKGDQIFLAIVDVTSTEILSISSTPKEIIAAPTSGKAIKPISHFVMILDYQGSAYSSTQLHLKFTGTSLRIAEADGGFLAATADTHTIMEENATNNSEVVAEAGLTLTANANPTGGNGNIRIYVPYTIIDV